MPKVYTRAVFSSSDHAAPTASARAVLRTYYCLCGDFALVLQGKLERLARRAHDGASIVRARQGRAGQAPRKFKLNVRAGERVVVRRWVGRGCKLGRVRRADARTDGTLEPRTPLLCMRCGTQREPPWRLRADAQSRTRPRRRRRATHPSSTSSGAR